MKARHFSKLSVHHSEKLDNQYEVAEKDFPADLMVKHTHYNGRRIRWLANFGYRHKATGAAITGRLDESYDIELEAPGEPDARLVYFDGSAVQPLETRPSDTTPGKVKATLDLGDPPIGWGGH